MSIVWGKENLWSKALTLLEAYCKNKKQLQKRRTRNGKGKRKNFPFRSFFHITVKLLVVIEKYPKMEEKPQEGGGVKDAGMDDLYKLIAEFESMAGPSSDPPPFPTFSFETDPASPRNKSSTSTDQDQDYSFGLTLKSTKSAQDALNLDFADVSIEKRKNRIEKEILEFEAAKPQTAVVTETGVLPLSSIISFTFIAFCRKRISAPLQSQRHWFLGPLGKVKDS
mgnify:CR=1 FL=1